MFSTTLMILPLGVSVAMAQFAPVQMPQVDTDQHLESRQASQYLVNGDFQGCFSSAGGQVQDQGYDTYQSSGNCGPICSNMNKPVMATQGYDCFCSDLLPSLADQVSDNLCSSSCPGIGSEDCGGGSQYFSVYVTDAADGTPPRVKGSSGDSHEKDTTSSSSTTATTSSTSSSTSSTPSTTKTPKVHHTPPPEPVRHSHPHHHPKPHPHPHKPQSQSHKTSVYKTTVQNTVYKTMSQTSSKTPAADSTHGPSVSPRPSESSSSSSSTGKTVGIAVGVIGGVVAFAALIAGILFYVRRRRRLKNAENGHRRADSLNAFVASGGYSAGPTPSTSMAGRLGPAPPSVVLNDSRLDPWVMRETRRESGASFLADNQDYSRRILKVTNPDNS